MDCGKAATDVMSRPESCSHQGGALRAAGVAPEVARTVAHLPHVMPILVNAVGWDNSVDCQQPAVGLQRQCVGPCLAAATLPREWATCMLDHQAGHKIQVTYTITAYWALAGGVFAREELCAMEDHHLADRRLSSSCP